MDRETEQRPKWGCERRFGRFLDFITVVINLKTPPNLTEWKIYRGRDAVVNKLSP